MPHISIEIPTNNDSRIRDSIQSIFAQKYQDFEVIVASNSSSVKEYVRDYDVKFIYVPNSETLLRRIIADDAAKGDYALLIESTRILDKECLGELDMHNEAMVIVEEQDLGNNWISKIQNRERSANIHIMTEFSPDFLVAEPRFFNRDILQQAYDKIHDIPMEILRKIQFGDLDIIYFETYSISRSVGVTKKPLLYHYSDKNISELIRKYYFYGKSNKILNGTKYAKKFRLKNHMRPYYGLKNTTLIYSLSIIKALSFFSGMYLTTPYYNKRAT